MKSFLISTIVVFLLGIILTFGVTFYFIQKHPKAIIDTLLTTISAELGNATISSSSVGLHLLPYPRIYLTNVIIQTPKDDNIHIEKCLITPNLTKILSGKVSIYSIEAIEPIASISFQNKLQKDSDTSPDNTLIHPSNFLQQLAGSKIFIENGSITFKNKKNRLKLLGVNGNIHVSKTLVGSLQFNMNEVSWEILGESTNDNHPMISQKSIKKVQLHVKNIQYVKNIPLTKTSSTIYTFLEGITKAELAASGTIPINDKTNKLTFNYTTIVEKDDSCPFTMHGQLNVEGALPNGNISAPIKLSIPFITVCSNNTSQLPPLLLKNAKLLFNKTHMDLSGTVKNYELLSNLSFDGTVDIKNFSLPYWFNFAKKLPNGIQYALDKLSGKVTFTLSPQQVGIQKIIIHSLDTKFQGSGTISNFSSPNIILSLTTKDINLNKLIPELEGKVFTQPSYPNQTFLTILTNLFYNNNNNNKSKKTVNYDIIIQADHVTCWNFEGYQFSCNIHPNLQDVQLNTTCKKFYDGTFSSSFLISKEHTVQLAIENVQLDNLTNIVTKKYQLKGRASGITHVHGYGDTLTSFLSSLKGTIDLHIADGIIKKPDTEAIPFSTIHLTCDSIGQPSKENSSSIIPYKGKWNIGISSPTLNGSIAMDGLIQFSTIHWLPIKADNVPSKVIYSIPGLQTVAYGNISFDVDKDILMFSNFQGEIHPGSTISGTIKANLEKGKIRQWEGSLTFMTQSLKKLLTKLDYEPKNISPTMLQYLTFQGDIFVSPTTVCLTNIQGVLDNTLFKLSLNGLQTNPPSWTGDIQLSSLNLDEYLMPIKQIELKNSQLLWPIELLNKVNLQSILTINEFIYRKVPYNDIVLPINLNQGVLSISPITASLCDGQTKASLKATSLSNSTAQIDFHYFSKNIDMLKLSKKRQQEYLISGFGTLDINIKSIAKSSIDFLKHLHGTWRISIQNGYFKRKTGTTQHYFSNIGATGSIVNGIITNKDFAVIGPRIAIKGSGKINLPQWTLNYLLTVDMDEFPRAIPISYTGSIDNPKRTINTASLILGTIGSFGSDTIGLIQDIFSAPLKLLLP